MGVPSCEGVCPLQVGGLSHEWVCPLQVGVPSHEGGCPLQVGCLSLLECLQGIIIVVEEVIYHGNLYSFFC